MADTHGMLPEHPLNDLSYRVIGAAMAAHRKLGPGHLEVTYERAMRIELGRRNIAFEDQRAIDVRYDEEVIGNIRIDLLVENALVVELKSVENTVELHRAQLRSYLRVGGFSLGLLINFNSVILSEGITRVTLLQRSG